MIKTVELSKADEAFPNEVEVASKEVILFLMGHGEYIIPFCGVLTNIPQNFIGNVRFMLDLEKYFHDALELNKYYIQSPSADEDTKILIKLLTSYFAFYDDINFQAFIQNNSRFSLSIRESPEELQRKAYARLKGYIFEQLVAEILKVCYLREHCQFERGCIVKIVGTVVQVEHQGDIRKTIDIAGVDTENVSCDMVECKVQPMRIDEINVKYVRTLYEKMIKAGYINANVGFLTAGTKESVQLKIAENCKQLNMMDPGLKAYDIRDLQILVASA